MIRIIKGDLYLCEMPELCCVIAYLLPLTGCGLCRANEGLTHPFTSSSELSAGTRQASGLAASVDGLLTAAHWRGQKCVPRGGTWL